MCLGSGLAPPRLHPTPSLSPSLTSTYLTLFVYDNMASGSSSMREDQHLQERRSDVLVVVVSMLSTTPAH